MSRAKRVEKLKPALKDYLWGGTKLKTVYQKESGLPRLAESWELSVHPDGESCICGGPWDGQQMHEYLNRVGAAAIGTNGLTFDRFPVLIKFIDAKKPLSVQVHPNDTYANLHENDNGKTEMWYVIDAEPDAVLYFGFAKNVTAEEVREKTEAGRLEEILNEVKVQPGDVFFIEAGTIHAIGAGILICEIQQSSNVTYRVYDYNRTDGSGKLRELHLDKALEVLNFQKNATIYEKKENSGYLKEKSSTHDEYVNAQNEKVSNKNNELIGKQEVKLLANCRYFQVMKHLIEKVAEIEVDDTSFASWIILSGKAEIHGPENTVSVVAGDSVFVPAGVGKVKLSGECTVIQTKIGKDDKEETE